jgi:hypothetical protein
VTPRAEARQRGIVASRTVCHRLIRLQVNPDVADLP